MGYSGKWGSVSLGFMGSLLVHGVGVELHPKVSLCGETKLGEQKALCLKSEWTESQKSAAMLVCTTSKECRVLLYISHPIDPSWPVLSTPEFTNKVIMGANVPTKTYPDIHRVSLLKSGFREASYCSQ